MFYAKFRFLLYRMQACWCFIRVTIFLPFGLIFTYIDQLFWGTVWGPGFWLTCPCRDIGRPGRSQFYQSKGDNVYIYIYTHTVYMFDMGIPQVTMVSNTITMCLCVCIYIYMYVCMFFFFKLGVPQVTMGFNTKSCMTWMWNVSLSYETSVYYIYIHVICIHLSHFGWWSCDYHIVSVIYQKLLGNSTRSCNRLPMQNTTRSELLPPNHWIAKVSRQDDNIQQQTIWIDMECVTLCKDR